VITDDRAYQAEIIPDSLRALGDQLATFFNVSPYHVGMKGDANHRGGYHRSRRFLTTSPYARDRHYSVTDSLGNSQGDPDWVCALDISLPAGLLIPMCARLDRAVRTGRFEKIAEWYGNDDGDNRVDGYDNIRNVVASSDPSHLWHAHIGFIRGRAGDDHSDVYDMLTGSQRVAAKMALLEDEDVDQKTGDAILAELQALNDFLMTGKRYGKSATAPPESTQIGLLHNELQTIRQAIEKKSPA
jgi:hypothetical protein